MVGYELGALGFLVMAAIISLSGSMMPGPVTAGAIVKGYKDGYAGIKIALGHAVVEFPLIAVIALGFATVLKMDAAKLVIGLAGGLMLIYMGIGMVRLRDKVGEGTDVLPYHPFVLGIVTSLNPYFFIWWATVGALLIDQALSFGAVLFVIFAVVHWSTDLGWDAFLSYATHRSRTFWTPRVQKMVFVFFGGLLVAFGIYFAMAVFL